MDGITTGIKSVTQTKLGLLILRRLDSICQFLGEHVFFHYVFVGCYVAEGIAFAELDYYIDKIQRIARASLSAGVIR